MRIPPVITGTAIAAAICLLALLVGQPVASAQESVISIGGNELLNTPVQLQPESETRSELKRILAMDEYHAEGQARQESWFLRQWKKLQALFSNASPTGNNTWGVALALLLLALVVFLVVRLAWQFATRARDGRARVEQQDPHSRSTDQLLSAAAEAEGRGDYRVAVRFRYLALLRSLNLPSATVLTNSQIKRRLAKNNPVLVGPFGQLVACYEDVWYGGFDCRQGEYAQADGLARDIEAKIAERKEDEAAQ